MNAFAGYISRDAHNRAFHRLAAAAAAKSRSKDFGFHTETKFASCICRFFRRSAKPRISYETGMILFRVSVMCSRRVDTRMPKSFYETKNERVESRAALDKAPFLVTIA